MTTPRSSCAVRMRSTYWHTSMRIVCPPPYASAHYSAVDAPRTCGAAWSTPSTCCSRGATEYHESAGWRPCPWLNHFFWWTAWTYVHWNYCSVCHEPSAQSTWWCQWIWGTSTGPDHRNCWIMTYENGELGWNQKRPLNRLVLNNVCLLYKYAAILLCWSLTAMFAFVDIEVASVGQGDV